MMREDFREWHKKVVPRLRELNQRPGRDVTQPGANLLTYLCKAEYNSAAFENRRISVEFTLRARRAKLAEKSGRRVIMAIVRWGILLV